MELPLGQTGSGKCASGHHVAHRIHQGPFSGYVGPVCRAVVGEFQVCDVVLGRGPDTTIEASTTPSLARKRGPRGRRGDALVFHQGIEQAHQRRALAGEVLQIENLNPPKPGVRK